MDHKVGEWVSVAHQDKPDACPMPALVASVNEDKTVNVCAFNHLGQPCPLQNLHLEAKPATGGYHLQQEKKPEPKHEEKPPHPKHEPPHRGRPPKRK